MRRAMAVVLAVGIAALYAACGGGTPTSPGTGAGNGGGGTGGGTSGGSGGVTSTPNTPPTVKSVTVSDTRIEVGTPVTLTATVEDAETPVEKLQFAWTLPEGSTVAGGNGQSITWTPGAGLITPLDTTVMVTVTETYSSGSSQLQNTATGTLALHINNSTKELADMSLKFLGLFADSKVSPDKCVQDFTDSCSGKKDEFADISDNRHDYEIVSSTLRHTGLSITPDRQKATVHTFCSFTSKVITTAPVDEYCANGKCPLGSIQGPVTGDCWTTNVYQKGRWWLCESHFTGQGGILTDFARAFFRIKSYEIR
jgi:hypothetical protein